MKLIPLTKGAFAMVDDEDFEFLSQWRWKISHNGYALRTTRAVATRWQAIYMHHVILPKNLPLQVDHINRKKTDNRRCNLRYSTASQNSCNSPLRSKNQTGYRGVYYQQKNRNFFARIHSEGVRIHLGCFPTKEEAKDAYNEAATRLHKEFAQLN